MQTLAHPMQDLAHAIRFLAVDAILAAGEGHQGVPLGMAEIATALYTQHLKHDPKNPTWFDRDRVVLSNGHGSMLLYALLYLSGYEKIDLEQIKHFRDLGYHTAGHPEYDPHAGIEITTGLLGQCIANAVGMAVAEAHLRARLGSDICHHHTYAFVGDGCLQEGMGQEAIALAGHLGLGNLIFLWDDNAITDDGATHLSISENVAERFRVAHWHVLEVDGHDIDEVSKAITAAKADPRPSLIACKTTIARGIARLQGQRGGHSGKLFAQDREQMQALFNWPHGSFDVPAVVLQAWRDSGTQSAQAHTAWQQRVVAMPAMQRNLFDDVLVGTQPSAAHLNAAFAQAREKLLAQTQSTAMGGINLSATIHAAIAESLPQRLTLCADLEAPTDHKRGAVAFDKNNTAGNYVHCGVREHLMGAMANGMAVHGGVLPVAVTYLAFSDYMRPTLRMAALMGLPTKFVFSHDSIGIGKNGPTHQPVEILASLRAMPNMLVIRPADAQEALECWQGALQHHSGPASLVFARQALPTVRAPEREAKVQAQAQSALPSTRGAYVLSDADTALGVRQITLLATGSEVQIALAAQTLLQAKGLPTAVVSMPCWEWFEQQDEHYRQQVLQPGTVTVAVEAAVEQGWQRYTRTSGAKRAGFVGMSSFGASGAADDLYQHFGITAEAVVTKVEQILQTPAA